MLVAWNLAVLTGILLLVAGTIFVTQSRSVSAAVDAQLRSQAQHEIASGHALQELGDASAAAPTSGAGTDEGTDPYEASESPNVFSWTVDAQGHVVRPPQDVRAANLPNMGAIRLVLAGKAPNSLMTLDTIASGHDAHFRLYTAPVRAGDHIVGAVQVGTSLEPRYAEVRNFLVLLLITGGIGVALAALGSVFLADRALVPVQEAFERQRAFVADASHELRTPLSLMRAEAELLVHGLTSATQPHLEVASDSCAQSAAESAPALVASPTLQGATADDPELAGLGRDLVAEVDYMSHLVSALLQLARMDAAAEPLRREIVALDALARRACQSARPLATSRGVRLTFVQPGEAGVEVTGAAAEHGPHPVAATDGEGGAEVADTSLRVLGDADRLYQLLLILLDNALRYTPALSCWRDVDHAGSGDLVIVEVTDTGVGIAPEHLPHIFDRFYRVDKARSRALGGSGLGLAIATKIAQAHGGTLTAESAVGVGTTLRLAVPAAPPA